MAMDSYSQALQNRRGRGVDGSLLHHGDPDHDGDAGAHAAISVADHATHSDSPAHHVLDANARDHIAAKNFAEPGERKYPIEDAAHARNALARVSQNGSPEEKKEVETKVHEKYPGIGDEAGSKMEEEIKSHVIGHTSPGEEERMSASRPRSLGERAKMEAMKKK